MHQSKTKGSEVLLCNNAGSEFALLLVPPAGLLQGVSYSCWPRQVACCGNSTSNNWRFPMLRALAVRSVGFYYCLVLLQVPKCFVPVQIFWAILKIWLHLALAQNTILLKANNLFVWHKMFVTAMHNTGPPLQIWARQGPIFYPIFSWPVVSYKSILNPKI